MAPGVHYLSASQIMGYVVDDIITHIFEELFWLIYAKESSANPNASYLSLIIDAATFKDKIFHNFLVLIGPLILILFLLIDIPSTSKSKVKEQ